MHPALQSTWPSMLAVSRAPDPAKPPDLEGFEGFYPRSTSLTQSLTDHYTRRVVRLDHTIHTLDVL